MSLLGTWSRPGHAMKQRSCGANSAGMTSSTRPTYNRAPQPSKGAHVSDQEQRDEPQTEEEIKDLDVSEEQTDDVTGGRATSRRAPRMDPDARK
jgi:hypothetical protein